MTKTISWSSWLEALRTQPEKSTELIDAWLDLNPLSDEGEAGAIKRAIAPQNTPVLFIQNNNRRLVAYKLHEDWEVRYLPEAADPEVYGRFLDYTLNVHRFLRDARQESSYSDYYSLNPLVYGGDYWLETVCRQEINRHAQEEPRTGVSVILMPLPSDLSLFEIVEFLRKGDRLGYFGTTLGILFLYLEAEEVDKMSNRLQKRFGLSHIHTWRMTEDFDNAFELRTLVRKSL